MASKVVIHIGAPKTGTTFIQSILWANQDRLQRRGITLPGSRSFDHDLAARAVMQWPGALSRHSGGPEVLESILNRIHTASGTAIISNEWLGMADRRHVSWLMEALAPANVDVVFTIRDLTELIPAAWQESLKLGNASRITDFIHSLDGEGGRWRWRSIDAAKVLPNWATGLPTASVKIVTLPPRGMGSGELWPRFAEACGIQSPDLEYSNAQANQSLSAEAAALLYRLGPSLRKAIDADNSPWRRQYRWIRRYFGHEILVPRKGSPITLSPEDWALLRERSKKMQSWLANQRFTIFGRLDDLSNSTSLPGAINPDEVSDSEMLELAIDVIPDMLETIRRLSK